VTVVSEDAHTADVYRDEISVRELARRHLRNPDARRVPCARRLMRELHDAVEGRRSSGGRGVSDERVFRLDEVVRALRLREAGAAYLTPTGCEVDAIYASRSELEPALRSGAAAHLALLTDPRRSVGVEAYRPSAACRAQLERGLAALASR
jgi:hypothetical protein